MGSIHKYQPSRSHAEQAKLWCVMGCEFDKTRAREYWQKNSFFGDTGMIRAKSVNLKNGILSVTFPDGSVLCPPHWQN